MQEDGVGHSTSRVIRLIYTTDLHMALGGQRTGGLAELAPAIEAARAEHPGAILCDVGDALQGTPFGEWLATGGASDWDVHPIYQMMNTLSFDVATLGNHDLDFGLDHMARSVSGLHAQLVCANLDRLDGVPPPDRFALYPVETGPDAPLLTVGFTGVIPSRVMRWNRHHLDGRVDVRDPAAAVAELIPQMRAAGADIIVVLAHTGIVPDGHEDEDEQAALRIGRIDGVDALLCGHQHLTFPGPELAPAPDIDPSAGTLAGTPAIMPGWAGQSLGILDLNCAHTASTGWTVADHSAAFRKPDAPVQSLLAPSAALRARHAAWEKAELSRCAEPLTTHFGSVMDCSAVRLTQSAMLHAFECSDHSTDLPLVVVAAPGKMGGRSGPSGYISICDGILTRQAVGELCPFPNRLSLIKVSGAMMREWLERSCAHLNVLDAGLSGQWLTNDAMPGYNFDSALGLTYEIDPTQPLGQRVQKLTRAGRALDDAEDLAVLTSSFRASGGGGFNMLDTAEVLLSDLCGLSDAVEHYLEDHAVVSLPPASWQMTCARPVTVLLRTGPTLTTDRPTNARHLATTADGWEEWEVTIGPLSLDQTAA
ncbi:5'-nucleotidase C-terminal domain-containing protein [Pontivivens insulae]|uniref:2',3'-cyclic-nucleotide 2'-phosphodiesterase/3'-nucleotidase n=1 Tax=Pontivivens insulae TaxID=1639689 RepID=A0A2R8AAM8_9RHOB|nr:5'-nucleotidase C-terminal domain-containing protein [Pontivivens insulae]RED13018.1 2',3'-cyclic-nucleotide 2'-phosphodiesterase/3'-nucleotidase [Pontivivens insulae]SPF29110.1 2',3'-cyclic-nucleotide 2'-phosphodiesterase/3'-nucleotidase [Pontivivens insulae]